MGFFKLGFSIGTFFVPYWAVIAVAVALTAVVIAVVIVLRKKKKKNVAKCRQESVATEVCEAEAEKEEPEKETNISKWLKEAEEVTMRIRKREQKVVPPVAEEKKIVFPVLATEKAEPLIPEPEPELESEPEAEEEPVLQPKPKNTVYKKVYASTKQSFMPVREKAEKVQIERKQGEVHLYGTSRGNYFFDVCVDGEVLSESKIYRTEANCVSAAEDFIRSVAMGRFSVRCGALGRYRFLLQSSDSASVCFEGREYKEKEECERNLASLKTALFGEIERITEEREEIELTLPSTLRSVEKGKWETVQADPGKKTGGYSFRLSTEDDFALFESRDYKTEASCKKGIETFKKTLENGCFTAVKAYKGYRLILSSAVSANTSFEGGVFGSAEDCGKILEYIYAMVVAM